MSESAYQEQMARLGKAQEKYQAEQSTIVADALHGRFTLVGNRGQGPELPLADARMGWDQPAVRFEPGSPAEQLTKERHRIKRPDPFLMFGGGDEPCWFKSRRPEELALEVKSVMDIKDEVNGDPKYLFGGLHYLHGAPDIFWSMIVNFLQTGQAIPTDTGGEVAEGYVKADEWHYLNQHWTAVLQDARNDPNNVLCMYHHKETGCLIQGCPFKHPSEVPLDLAAAVKKMKKQVASSPDEGSASRSFQPPAQGCCQCGTSGVKLFRCKQCNGMDARYCSRKCQKSAWPGHKATCKQRAEASAAKDAAMQESMDNIMGITRPDEPPRACGGSSDPHQNQQQQQHLQPHHHGDVMSEGGSGDPASSWNPAAAMPSSLSKVWKATGDGTDITLDYNTGDITLGRVAGGTPVGNWSKQGLDGSAVQSHLKCLKGIVEADGELLIFNYDCRGCNEMGFCRNLEMHLFLEQRPLLTGTPSSLPGAAAAEYSYRLKVCAEVSGACCEGRGACGATEESRFTIYAYPPP